MRNLKLSTIDIKVGYDELFYDLIFVVIITKITSLFLDSATLSTTDLFINIGLFIFLVASWRYRLLHNSKVHMLSNKLDTKIENTAIISYVELLAIIVILHYNSQVSVSVIIELILVVLITTFISMSKVRGVLFDYLNGLRKENITKREWINKHKDNYVNVKYLIERYMILVILFLGEIILSSYILLDSTLILLIVLVLIVKIFNIILNIVENFETKITQEVFTERIYRDVNHLFTVLLTLLMLLISYIDYASHYKNMSIIVLLGFFLLIFLHVSKMKYKLDI